MSTSVLSSVVLIEKRVDAFLQPGFWKVLNHLLISAARAACSPWLVAEAFPFYSHQPQNTACSSGSCSCRLLPWEWFSRHNLWNLFHFMLCVWGIGHCASPPTPRGPDCTGIFFLWLAPMQFSSKVALFVFCWSRDIHADYVDMDPYHNLVKLFK